MPHLRLKLGALEAELATLEQEVQRLEDVKENGIWKLSKVR